MGERHSQAYKLHSKVKINGFWDVIPTKAKKLGLKFNGKVYPTLDSLMDDSDIEAVSICSPNVSHFNILKHAIKSRKKILVEKPIVTKSEHCDIIMKLMRKTSARVMVGHTHRFFPCNIALKKILDSGKIGTPRIINTFDYIPGRIKGQKMPPWIKSKKMSGGGILMTDLVHTVDKISWLMNSKIKKVSAPLLSDFITKRKLDDAGMANLWLKNGSMASCVHVCPSPGTWDMSTKIIGTKGEVSLKFAGDLKLYKNKITSINYPHKGNYITHSNAGFYNEIDEFIKSIEEKREPKINYKDGISAVRIILALYKSFMTKKPVSIAN